MIPHTHHERLDPLEDEVDELEFADQQEALEKEALEALTLAEERTAVSEELQEIKARRARLEDEDHGSDNIWERIANRSVDLGFFVRHRWFIGYTVLLLLLSILWSYRFANQHREVAFLEVAVRDMHNKSLFSTAERIRMERVASIQQQIEQLGLNLRPATRPPYILKPVIEPE